MRLLIVNFHYIREQKYKSGIYPKTLREIDSYVELFHKKGYEFISQSEIFNLKNKKKYVMFTFDDGLKEQMDAYEFLKKKGVPAIFYVSTYPIKNRKVLDVHKLHYIRANLEDKIIFNFASKYVSNISFPDNLHEFYRYDNIEAKKVKYLFNFILKNELKTKIIDELFTQLANEEEFAKNLYMSIQDLKELHKNNLLGTHTHHHLPLAALSDTDIKKEINLSLDYLQELDIRVDSISYPYGGSKSVNARVEKIAKEFNFKFGLTMFRGVNFDLTKPLQLKRIDVNDIKDFI